MEWETEEEKRVSILVPFLNYTTQIDQWKSRLGLIADDPADDKNLEAEDGLDGRVRDTRKEE